MSALPTGDTRTVHLTVPAPDKAAWVGASRARGQRLGDYLLERIRCGELPLIEPSAAGIAAWRARIGATQAQAAELIGVTRVAIAKWEAGDSRVDRRTVLACAAVEFNYRCQLTK